MNAPTPRYGHDPIEMRERAGRDECEQLGDFWIDAAGARIEMLIPSKTGAGWVPINLPIADSHDPGKAWEWDGNRSAPTLTPSVHTHGHWHGWVRDGQLVEA